VREHAVDLDSGAVVAVTLQAADEGDTTNGAASTNCHSRFHEYKRAVWIREEGGGRKPWSN